MDESPWKVWAREQEMGNVTLHNSFVCGGIWQLWMLTAVWKTVGLKLGWPDDELWQEQFIRWEMEAWGGADEKTTVQFDNILILC